jgi:hypothetical protein
VCLVLEFDHGLLHAEIWMIGITNNHSKTIEQCCICLLFIDILLLVLVSDLCQLVFLLIKYSSVLG